MPTTSSSISSTTVLTDEREHERRLSINTSVRKTSTSFRVWVLLASIFALVFLVLNEDVFLDMAHVMPQAALLRSTVSCLSSVSALVRKPPPVASAIVNSASGRSDTSVFDASYIADTMGLFGAFARVQRPHFAWKLDKNPQENTDRRHTFPIITGDGFRSLSDYVADRNFEVSTLKTQLLRDDTRLFERLTGEQALIIFLGNDDSTLDEFLNSNVLETSIRPIVLIVLNGDNNGISPHDSRIEHIRLYAVFTQNCVGTSEKVFCLPIGIENRQWSMHGWTPETLMGSMLGSLRGPSPFDRMSVITDTNSTEGETGAPLAFACFGVHTWPQEREPLANMIDSDRAKAWRWVSRDCNRGLVHFHRAILDVAAVIAPRGHGLDTLRAWESLYLGRVIVTKKGPMDDLWSSLPVILLDDWKDLSLETVIQGIKALSTPQALEMSRAATPKLFIPYWACEIGKAARRSDEFCSIEALLASYTRGDGE